MILKKFKTVLFLSLMAMIGAGTNSCSDDVLDKEPLDAISANNVFTDATFLQNYVFNVYNGIRPPWRPGSGSYIGMTDIAVHAPDTHDRAGGIREYLAGNLTPDNVSDLTSISGGQDLWNFQYDYIKRINTFFDETDGAAEPANLAELQGRMHFIRAWIYFDLSRHFGGVPLITTTFELDDESFDVSRSTYDEVIQFVLGECDNAIALLDGLTPRAGEVSKEAAMALKARILLYAASPLNNPSNDMSKWQAAEAATKAVIDLGFTLHDTHEDLYLQPLKSNEIIFGRTFTAGSRIPDWGYNYDYWPSGFDARQRLMPTQTFINMFQMSNGEYPYQEDGITVNSVSGYDPQDPNTDRDPRYYDFILYPGGGPVNIVDGAKSTERLYEYWEDANPNADNNPPYQNPNTVDPNNGQELFDFGRDSETFWIKGLTPFHWRVQTGYTFRKLLDFTGPRASFDFDYNQVVIHMRLTEFYLNYAEIQLALGNDDVAREYINLVRKRPSVNMPDITSTGTDLVRDYRNERAIELHLEDSHFFDLMRWKAAPGKVDLNPIRGLTDVLMDWTNAEEGDLLGELSYEYGEISAADPRSTWPGDYYYLFPIPREEIQRSNNNIEQNPGY